MQDWIQWRSNDSYSNSFHFCSVSGHHPSPSIQSALQFFSKMSSVAWEFWTVFLVWSEGFSRDSSFYLNLKSHRTLPCFEVGTHSENPANNISTVTGILSFYCRKLSEWSRLNILVFRFVIPVVFYANEGGWVRQNTNVVGSYLLV